jgi:hypothetical protein
VNNLKQFAHPEDWSKVRLDKVTRLTCVIERREEGAFSIAPLLTSCPNVRELSVSVVVRYKYILEFFHPSSNSAAIK